MKNNRNKSDPFKEIKEFYLLDKKGLLGYFCIIVIFCSFFHLIFWTWPPKFNFIDGFMIFMSILGLVNPWVRYRKMFKVLMRWSSEEEQKELSRDFAESQEVFRRLRIGREHTYIFNYYEIEKTKRIRDFVFERILETNYRGLLTTSSYIYARMMSGRKIRVALFPNTKKGALRAEDLVKKANEILQEVKRLEKSD